MASVSIWRYPPSISFGNVSEPNQVMIVWPNLAAPPARTGYQPHAPRPPEILVDAVIGSLGMKIFGDTETFQEGLLKHALARDRADRVALSEPCPDLAAARLLPVRFALRDRGAEVRPATRAVVTSSGGAVSGARAVNAADIAAVSAGKDA